VQRAKHHFFQTGIQIQINQIVGSRSITTQTQQTTGHLLETERGMQFDFANRYLVIQTATADGRSLDDAVLEDNLVAAAADEEGARGLRRRIFFAICSSILDLRLNFPCL
jgi:hypothetical protein